MIDLQFHHFRYYVMIAISWHPFLRVNNNLSSIA